MSDTEQEPSMEEILASIRRIISDDDKEMEASAQENEDVPELKDELVEEEVEAMPEPELEPEYSDNFEISINYNLKTSLFQLEFFNTNITNAIYRGLGSISGEDSLIYDGEMMRIQTNKNIHQTTFFRNQHGGKSSTPVDSS